MKYLSQTHYHGITAKFVFAIVIFLFASNHHISAQQSWLVTNTSDSGLGSLRAQIDSAGIADTIRFSPMINGDSIKLTSGQITTFDDLILIGNGEENTIIDGSLNTIDRLFLLNDDVVNDTSSIEFRNMTFQHGSNLQPGSKNGGAMRIRVNAKFVNCTFAYNTALIGSGGAVECIRPNLVQFSNCTFHNNTASGLGGAVISTFQHNTIFTNCLFFDNIGRDGGAISITSSSHAVLINNTITNNHGTQVTGGVDPSNGSSIELYNNIISGNTAGSGNPDFRLNSNTTLVAAHHNIIRLNPFVGGPNSFIIGYPDFVDTANNNFQLLDLSLGVDMADSLFLPIDSCDIDGDANTSEIIDIDHAGNQRIQRCALDIGAFENQSISFCPSINDLCENAVFIECNSFVFDSTILATSLDVPSLCGVTSSSPGLWYSILGSGDSTVISTDDGATDFDTQIQVFSGSCNNLVCIGGDDNSGTGNTSTFSFTSMLGTTYHIYISGVGTAGGSYKLSVDCIDPCPSIRTINGTITSAEFFADSVIHSDALIATPANVLFQAGNEINLESNFEVEEGAEFDANIGDCP